MSENRGWLLVHGTNEVINHLRMSPVCIQAPFGLMEMEPPTTVCVWGGRLGLESRAWCLLGKHFTTELCPKPSLHFPMIEIKQNNKVS